MIHRSIYLLQYGVKYLLAVAMHVSMLFLFWSSRVQIGDSKAHNMFLIKNITLIMLNRRALFWLRLVLCYSSKSADWIQSKPKVSDLRITLEGETELLRLPFDYSKNINDDEYYCYSLGVKKFMLKARSWLLSTGLILRLKTSKTMESYLACLFLSDWTQFAKAVTFFQS